MSNPNQINRFENFPPQQDMPALDAFEIDPADGVLLSEMPRALYVGIGGDIQIKTSRGNFVMFVGVPSGAVLPVRAAMVSKTGTTADKIVGLV